VDSALGTFHFDKQPGELPLSRCKGFKLGLYTASGWLLWGFYKSCKLWI